MSWNCGPACVIFNFIQLTVITEGSQKLTLTTLSFETFGKTVTKQQKSEKDIKFHKRNWNNCECHKGRENWGSFKYGQI